MHPATLEVLQHFAFAHLPPHLQEVSKRFAVLAVQMVQSASGPEVTAGLRHLLEAKDCFVRAARASNAADSVAHLIAAINGARPPLRDGLVLIANIRRSGNVHLYWGDPATYEAVGSTFITSGTRDELIGRGVSVILEEPPAESIGNEG